MKKNVIITGGTGFLGSNFITKYSDSYNFLVISRQPLSNAVHPDSLNQKIIDGFMPEYFIHLATNADMNVNLNSISDIIKANIEFPTKVLEMFIAAGGKKVLNVGTYWEHMNNSQYSPNSMYAASKKAFEDLLQYYVDLRGAEAITLKVFDNYGKKDPRRKILRLVYEAHKSKVKLGLTGGEQLLNLVHVDDVISAFESALNQIKPGHHFYLVKNDQPRKLKDIIIEFCEINNLTPPLEWGVRPYGPQEFFTDITVHPILPNWKPFVSSKDGLKDLYQD